MRDHARLMQCVSKNGPFSVKQVQQRGTCMFASIRRCINCPFEWTNTYLNRQVAAHIMHNVEFLHPIISVHIQGNYGHLRLSADDYKNKLGTLTQEEKEDYEAPGPFSLVTYLKALIKKKFYGNQIVLMVISMMWQGCVSILNAETLRQIKIRTSNKINKVDIALAHCQYNHYILLGKCHDLSMCHHDLSSVHCDRSSWCYNLYCCQ